MTVPISVLLPVRNGAAFLPDAIASLRAQTFGEFEVIAVDDGSTDATGELLAAWAADDPRVQVIRQAATGLVPSLERARSLARGRFLARMDADDVSLPERFQLQHLLLDIDPTFAGCGVQVEYFPREGVQGGALRYERWVNGLVTPEEIERDLFVECPLPHPTFLLRAQDVAAAGGYQDHGWPEDYDLLLRIWRAGGRLTKVPRVLLRWRERPDRLSRVAEAYTAEAFRRCKVHHLSKSLLRGRNGVVVWGAGPTGKAFARSLLQAGIELRAFVDLDPRKLGQRVHGALVVPPEESALYRDAFSVAAVGQPGARDRVRVSLLEAGWREMVDCCAVA